MPNSSDPVVYGRYVIKTVKAGSAWKGLAWRRDSRVGDIEIADSRDNVIAAVKAQIDKKIAEDRTGRSPEGYPSAKEVRSAMTAIRSSLSDGQNKMLMAHLAAPEHILTATELAHAAGYKDYASANVHYGSVGRMLAEEMDWLPQQQNLGQPVWTFTLATDAGKAGVSSAAYEEFRWRMRPKVVTALQS